MPTCGFRWVGSPPAGFVRRNAQERIAKPWHISVLNQRETLCTELSSTQTSLGAAGSPPSFSRPFCVLRPLLPKLTRRDPQGVEGEITPGAAPTSLRFASPLPPPHRQLHFNCQG